MRLTNFSLFFSHITPIHESLKQTKWGFYTCSPHESHSCLEPNSLPFLEAHPLEPKKRNDY